MLSIKTVVKPSKIHGLGCFAAEDIPVNTHVWRYIRGFDSTWTKREILSFPVYAQQYLYTYIWKSKVRLDCYVLHGDNARYINSTDKPNLKCWPSSCAGGYFATALKKIEVGEELIWNYLEFDLIDLSKDNLFEVIRKNCNMEPDAYDDFIEKGIKDSVVGYQNLVVSE